jgi:ribosomal protein S6
LKTYEAMYIFSTSLDKNALENCLGRVRDEITKLKGTVSDTRVLGNSTFARTMKKWNEGQYVRMEFTMDPANVDHLRARLKLNEDVFRVQVVRAEARPAEGPVAPKEGESHGEPK